MLDFVSSWTYINLLYLPAASQVQIEPRGPESQPEGEELPPLSLVLLYRSIGLSGLYGVAQKEGLWCFRLAHFAKYTGDSYSLAQRMHVPQYGYQKECLPLVLLRLP